MMPAQGAFCQEERAFFLTFRTGPDADGEQDDKIGAEDEPVEALHVMGIHFD